MISIKKMLKAFDYNKTNCRYQSLTIIGYVISYNPPSEFAEGKHLTTKPAYRQAGFVVRCLLTISTAPMRQGSNTILLKYQAHFFWVLNFIYKFKGLAL